MARKFGFLFLGVCLVISTLGFIGCDTESEGGGASLVGYWKSDYGDGFEISETTFNQYDDATKAISFAGTIVKHSDFSAKYGTLTIKITDAGSWYKTKDHYLVVMWKDLTESGVRQASASKYVGEGSAENDFALGKPTQAEAETLYTESNGYFGTFGAYSKQ
jgi:hypothetical protein